MFGMQRHCNKKTGSVLTMDALKKDADDCVSKMNYKINWLLCMKHGVSSHSLSPSAMLLLLLLAYFVFGPALYHREQKYFWKFMQQQINIVGMIANAFCKLWNELSRASWSSSFSCSSRGSYEDFAYLNAINMHINASPRNQKDIFFFFGDH